VTFVTPRELLVLQFPHQKESLGFSHACAMVMKTAGTTSTCLLKGQGQRWAPTGNREGKNHPTLITLYWLNCIRGKKGLAWVLLLSFSFS